MQKNKVVGYEKLQKCYWYQRYIERGLVDKSMTWQTVENPVKLCLWIFVKLRILWQFPSDATFKRGHKWRVSLLVIQYQRKHNFIEYMCCCFILNRSGPLWSERARTIFVILCCSWLFNEKVNFSLVFWFWMIFHSY